MKWVITELLSTSKSLKNLFRWTVTNKQSKRAAYIPPHSASSTLWAVYKLIMQGTHCPPLSELGTHFTDLGRIEGWVNLEPATWDWTPGREHSFGCSTAVSPLCHKAHSSQLIYWGILLKVSWPCLSVCCLISLIVSKENGFYSFFLLMSQSELLKL